MDTICLIESKMANVWYSENHDWLCKLTARGFVPELFAFRGKKSILIKKGYK